MLNFRFLRYLLVGACGFVIDTGTTLLLISFGNFPAVSRIPGFFLALTMTYLLNVKFVFQSTNGHKLSPIKYLFIGIAGSIANLFTYLALSTVISRELFLQFLCLTLSATVGLLTTYLFNLYVYIKSGKD